MVQRKGAWRTESRWAWCLRAAASHGSAAHHTAPDHQTIRAAAVERSHRTVGWVHTVLDELLVQPLPQPASSHTPLRQHTHLKHFQASMFRPLPFERTNGPVAGWCLACVWSVVWVVVGLRTRARSARARRDSRPPPPHDRQACASRISHCPHPTTITPSRQSTDSLSRKKKTGHPFPFNDLRKDSGLEKFRGEGKGFGRGCWV